MIILFMGLPGSGKTLDVIKKIIDNLKLGRTIYTNVDGIDLDTCREHIKLLSGLDDYEMGTRLNFLTIPQVKEFWLHCKPGSLIVIDEVHKWFDNRSWASEGNKEMNSWASTHRHHGYDLVLVTQHVEKVDKHIRSLIEWTYAYRKVTFLGSFFQRKFIKYSYSGDDVSGKPLGKNGGTYDTRLFSCYRSYMASDVKELGIMKHVNILKHPVFIALPIVLIFALYMLFGKSSIATGDLFGARKALAKSSVPISSKPVAVKPVIVEKRDKPALKVLDSDLPSAEDWRKVASSRSRAPVVPVKDPCELIGSIEGVDGVKTILRRCGDVVEKYIDGHIQSSVKRSVDAVKVLTGLKERGDESPLGAMPPVPLPSDIDDKDVD